MSRLFCLCLFCNLGIHLSACFSYKYKAIQLNTASGFIVNPGLVCRRSILGRLFISMQFAQCINIYHTFYIYIFFLLALLFHVQ